MPSFPVSPSTLAFRCLQITFTILLLFQENVSSAALCTNIPAGLKKMSQGVDITKISTLPMDFTEVDGYLSPVIDFTCDKGKIWKNPYDEQIYQIPDQVAGIVSVPGGWENIITKVYTTYSDVKSDLSTEVGVDFLKGMFSASLSSKHMKHAISYEMKVITDVHAFVSTTEVVFNPGFALGLNRNGQLLLDQLPDSFPKNPDDYYKFISYFGTHYFLRGKLGGYIREYFEMDQSYFWKKSERYVKAQAKASFVGKLFGKADASRVFTKTSVDTDFTSNTNSHFLHYGGDRKLFQENGLVEWQSTVQSNPWLFGGSLMPIYDMINNTAKRESMKQAVEAHMDKVFLEELLSLLKSVEYNPGLKLLEEKLDKQLQKAIPDHDTVMQLGNEIDDVLITPPSWWLKATFCVYRYYYRNSNGNKYGHYKSCAALGGYTAMIGENSSPTYSYVYQWGLMAETSEDWFSQVQICSKYRPGPDADSAQCNNGISLAEVCAPVNSYTSLYYDKTDDRPGGCLLSWQLRVPSESPNWLKKTQLCFKWKENHGYKTGECGLGLTNNTLCAFANAWTTEYLDDTDSRNDYCIMQWGITDSRMMEQQESEEPQQT